MTNVVLMTSSLRKCVNDIKTVISACIALLITVSQQSYITLNNKTCSHYGIGAFIFYTILFLNTCCPNFFSLWPLHHTRLFIAF